MIDMDHGQSYATCVTAGSNCFPETEESGDDEPNGDLINTGDDGICDTTANTNNLVPANVPSAAELEDYLNNTTWGKQANVYCTVYRSDTNVNYDLDLNGELKDPSFGTNEISRISAIALDSSKDFNVYYVSKVQKPAAFKRDSEAWIGDEHDGVTLYVSAHETGHLLGDEGGGITGVDLMAEEDSDQSPTRILKVDWDAVNADE